MLIEKFNVKWITDRVRPSARRGHQGKSLRSAELS